MATSGVYVPPFKLARLLEESKDRVDPQRAEWEALRKTINLLTNKVNVSNVAEVAQELMRENILRGRGTLARAIIKAQMSSPGFTHIYASLLSIINSRLPVIGSLVVNRVVLQFRRSFRRHDVIVCKATVRFIAHMVNQSILDETVAVQMFVILLEKPTSDSIRIAVEFFQDVGKHLKINSRALYETVTEKLRFFYSQPDLPASARYQIEVVNKTIRNDFEDYPAVLECLDLVPEEDKITHEIDLMDGEVVGEEMLNIFKAKPQEEYDEETRGYAEFVAQVLGSDSEEGESEDSEAEPDEDEEEDVMKIKDYTEQDLINLRKTIYLSIMSSASFEECVHKILKLNIRAGSESEVCTMLIDCCAQEKMFQTFYPLQATRLCQLKEEYRTAFMKLLVVQYDQVHRLETNPLRNTAKFFAQLVYSDGLPWSVLELFDLSEESTTSSSRIFIKFFFQEVMENLGIEVLKERLSRSDVQPHIQCCFPTTDPVRMRFCYNYFMAIGLGPLVEKQQELLGL